MLVSTKLITNMVCLTLSCEHSSDIPSVTLDYDGKSKFGIDLLVLSRFIRDNCPSKWRGQLSMNYNKLEEIFLDSRVNFHKYGTSLGHVYTPVKATTESSSIKKQGAPQIVIGSQGDVTMNEDQENTFINIVSALGKDRHWREAVQLLEEIYGEVVFDKKIIKTPQEAANHLRDYYLQKIDPDLILGDFCETEDQLLLILHSHFLKAFPLGLWYAIYRHMPGRSEQECKQRLQRKSQNKNDLTLENLDLQDLSDNIPALFYYKENYCFALTLIPQMDRSKMNITSKLQHESRFLVLGTVNEIFLVPCKESAIRCQHTGLSAMNFTYNPTKPSSQFETYLKLTFANGLKRAGLIESDFPFDNLIYKGPDIHTLMSEIETNRFIVPKEMFMILNDRENERRAYSGKKHKPVQQ